MHDLHAASSNLISAFKQPQHVHINKVEALQVWGDVNPCLHLGRLSLRASL